MQKKNRKQNSGFTVPEMMVVIFIILLFSALSLLNYKSAQQKLALQRAAYKLAQDIRKVQEKSMSAEIITGCAYVPGSYGLYMKDDIDLDNPSYFIFVKAKGQTTYSYVEGDCQLETFTFERGITYNQTSNLNITFQPPDPQVSLYSAGAVVPGSSASITVYLKDDPSASRTITVNKAGLVEIQ